MINIREMSATFSFGRDMAWAWLFTVLLFSASLAAESLISEPILPVPLLHGEDARKVALGARLFSEPRLSKNNSISCAHCHPLEIGGMDRLPRSFGVNGAVGPINAPTVYNAGFNLAQFWDGRVRDLAEQVIVPVHNPHEMASSWSEVIPRLQADTWYREQFQAIYGKGATSESIKDAIATFERSLITPGSRFDLWLKGATDSLSEQEQNGYVLFKSYGCVACHQGVNVGGNMYHLMGVMGDYFSDRGGAITEADLGRFNVTGNEQDKHFFKVPGLRLVVLSAPYFHDAGAETLERAIRIMAAYQLGRDMPEEDVAAIAAFLNTLVGRHPRLKP